MTIQELIEKAPLKVVAGGAGLQRTMTFGVVSDLLSNVMGLSDDGCVWVTMHVHQNIIAVASLASMSAVIVAGGAQPDKDTIEKADSEGIPLLTTELSQFEITGRIYSFGIKG